MHHDKLLAMYIWPMLYHGAMQGNYYCTLQSYNCFYHNLVPTRHTLDQACIPFPSHYTFFFALNLIIYNHSFYPQHPHTSPSPSIGTLSLKALALLWIVLVVFLLLANAATDTLWTAHWTIVLLPLVMTFLRLYPCISPFTQ